MKISFFTLQIFWNERKGRHGKSFTFLKGILFEHLEVTLILPSHCLNFTPAQLGQNACEIIPLFISLPFDPKYLFIFCWGSSSELFFSRQNANHKKFSLSSKSGTLLPEFPNAKNVQLPEDVSSHKVLCMFWIKRKL